VANSSGAGAGLTTTKAPFIEAARAEGRMFIEQPYELYSAENQATWGRLNARMQDHWATYANTKFLDGIANLCLDPARIPRLEDVNKFMVPRTGFVAKAVSGYVPVFQFFDALSRREFPTTVTIRDGASLDYLPEPDIFHDIAGHVPMHMDRAFADALVRFGQSAHTAAAIVSGIADPRERVRRLTSIQKALTRFFWFTIEFGLMRGPRSGELKVYGSGLLSSYGEIAHAIDAPEVERSAIDLELVVNQPFEIDHYQPRLFVVDSFEHVFDLVGELERWMKDGRLNDVAGGSPEISEDDLQSFLDAGTRAA
jgi:phenylalanine-4-hydroxylase